MTSSVHLGPAQGELPCFVCGHPIVVQRLRGNGKSPDMMVAIERRSPTRRVWFGFNRTEDERTDVVLCCSKGCAHKLTKGT